MLLTQVKCVFVAICTYILTYIHTYIHAFTHAYLHILTYIHTYTYTYTHISLHSHTNWKMYLKHVKCVSVANLAHTCCPSTLTSSSTASFIMSTPFLPALIGAASVPADEISRMFQARETAGRIINYSRVTQTRKNVVISVWQFELCHLSLGAVAHKFD